MGARSKACRTCKSRRVRCDEAQPKCTRCVKAGIACQGYEPRFTFVDENPRIERSQRIVRAQQEELRSRDESLPLVYHSARMPGIERLAANPVPMQMPLKAFSRHISTSFLVAKVFAGRARYDAAFSGVCSLPDTWWIHEAAKQSPKSLQALASMFFGRHNALPEMCWKAIQLYGESIAELRAELANQRRKQSFWMLASMTALCMYELISLRMGPGWRMHVDGLSRLIEIRGPSQYKHFPERSMFLEHRCILVSKAIIAREKTFLSQPEWKTVPWEDDPHSKMPSDYLIDILCDAAGILADLLQHGPASSSEGFDLRQETKGLLDLLNDWWREWSNSHSQSCQTVSPDPSTTMTKDSAGLIFPTLLRYDSIWTAHTVVLYDTARITLLTMWNILSRDFHQPLEVPRLTEPNNTPLLGISSDITGLAHEIIRSLEYCHETSWRFVGTFCVILSQDVAYSCLRPESRESRFLTRQGGQFFDGNIGGLIGGTKGVSPSDRGLPTAWTEAASACVH